MTRCAIYLRVSTAGQGRSLPAQEESCRALAADRGLDVVEIFSDDGVSAFKAVDRPQFRRLLDAAGRGEFTVLLIDSYDRLSRREDQEGILGLCWQLDALGVAVESASEHTPEDAALANMMRLMMSVTSNQESQRKSDRAKRGATRRAREGKFSGHAPYGYRWEEGALAPDPDAAPIVERIFSDWLDGTSQAEVARQLDLAGVPTARGGRWQQATVGQILRNVVYTGQFAYDGAVYDGEHPAIVSLEDFKRAQALMAPKKSSAGGHGRNAQHHLLSRMLVCGECGEMMLCRAGPQNKDGSRYRTYVCPTSSGKLAGRCSMPPVRQADVDSAVLSHFTEHVIDIEATKAAFRVRQDSTLARLKDEAERAASAVTRARHAESRVTTDYTGGKITAEQYGRIEPGLHEAVERAARQADAALDNYNEARAADVPADLETKVAERLSTLAETVAGRIEGGSGTVTQQRAQLAQVFERFTVFKGDVDPANADLHPTWPLGRAETALDAGDAEALRDSTPDLGEERLHSRTENPEAAVALGEPDDAVTFTILPELRPDVVEGWGIDCQPVASRVALSLSAVGDDAATARGTAGTAAAPTPTADSTDETASSGASALGQNDKEGLAT